MKKVSVKFDISPKGEFCEGEAAFNGSELISASENGTEKFNIGEISHILQRTDVGCGSLEIVFKNSGDDSLKNATLCRFSLSHIYEMGEFANLVNHFIETGEFSTFKSEAHQVCKKCGRALPIGSKSCIFCVKKSGLFKRISVYFKPYKKGVVISGLLLAFANILSALMPYLNSILIDNYLLPTKNALPYFSNRAKGVVVFSLLMALTFAFSKFVTIISERMSNRIGSSFSRDLRNILYKKIQYLTLKTMSERSAGNLMNRVTQDTEKVKDFINQQGRYLISQIILFTIILVVLLKTEPILTCLVFLPVPIGAVIMTFFRASTMQRFRAQWRINANATSVLHDIIKGIRVIKAFGTEEREIDKFKKINYKFAKISESNGKYFTLTYPLVANFMAIGEFFVLIIGGKMVLEGTLTLGELTRFNLYLGFLYAPLRWVSTLPRSIADCTTSLVKIFEILDDNSEKIEETKESFNPQGDIKFNNVYFGYKSYEPVLKNINLNIKSGEMLGLVGESGAGKSTIINLCMGLYDTTEGSITIDGKNIKDISKKELRENIGVVFQETFLFTGSVFENIAYGKKDATKEEVITAAKKARAHEFILNLPDGYNTVIGENGHTLSGGERQRLSIARAILKNPKILILDEATSSLDPETEIKIQEALGELIEGRTTIAIAHRLATLKNANRLAVIDKGKVAEIGTHSELISLGGIYAGLVEAQRETQKLKN